MFLAGNDLPSAWRNRRSFTIAETGFGTGLNFLATWHLWRRTAPPESRLHYLSVEGFPLTGVDLERVHAPFGELAPLARQLRAFYPHRYGGFHRLHFDDDRLTLTLLFGEAGDMLDALDAQVDAWFLDGFSPAKNPDLWRPAVLNRLGALTRTGGTAASFTVAGNVRRELEMAGFLVEKAPGFGRKRHMLRAYRTKTGAGDRIAATGELLPSTPSTALIVGSGLAGSAVAHALARRRINVTLIDPDPDLQRAASGNPAGIAAPKPTADASPAGRFHCAAFDYAQRHIFRQAPQMFRHCGVLELAIHPQARRRYDTLASGEILPPTAMSALPPEEASDAAGIAIPGPALYYPQAGIAFPRAYATLLRQGGSLKCEQAVRLAPTDRGWTAELDNGGRVSADIAVIACGNGSGRFGPPDTVPMTASRGQLSLVPATDESNVLRMALSFGGYVSPAFDGHHVLGATYDDVTWPPPFDTPLATQADHLRNHRLLMNTLPGFPFAAPGDQWGGRVAFRCTTPDRLPVCGPVPDLPPLPLGKAAIASDLPTDRQLHRSYKDGLFLCAGLGSRGLATAPLLGELLASSICAEPLPTEHVVTELLHPARFFVRALRKAGISAHS